MQKMDQWKPQDLSKTASAAADSAPQPVTVTSNRFHNNSNQQIVRERVHEDPSAARKVQKADREKLRRGRLNDQFHELGNTLDPDRPRNDKATILNETIQMIKDLSAQVNRLKMEHKALSEESRELMQEKNELREEKASLKSDIENLNTQYQQRVRTMFPWTSIDHSVVMSSPYSYPVPIPIPSAPISIHPSLQPFPIFGNQYVPFSAPANPPVEYASTSSHVSTQIESGSKSPGHRRPGDAKRCSESHEVATELELKMPGSSADQSCTSGGRKGKHSVMEDRVVIDESASSRYSPSQGLQDSSSSVGDIPKPDN
ncbi:transcription factor bHLH121-like [Gastrolobium bilobum]|uniref:transcription factor bHLH121-like n=1 Tax=Gastrolobium bilobum TaxID=150636 RepID=UPI002AB038C0|nr:transcription factor bHLH121-like [Gastrolobium bilobum]